MLKVYGNNRNTEHDMLAFLAEFKCRVFVNYPIKGVTRKVRGTTLYRVVNAPIR